MDRGHVTESEDALYTSQGERAVEDHGVDLDVEMENEPADLLAGHDRQRETAVGILIEEIANMPAGLPASPPLLPAYPPAGVVEPQPGS